ncbi:MAG TPA: hypothetical protein VLU25_12320 [Acidobacteriota bacterium]|nr:hypothetical protein [Acidobacteriota bacterium]
MQGESIMNSPQFCRHLIGRFVRSLAVVILIILTGFPLKPAPLALPTEPPQGEVLANTYYDTEGFAVSLVLNNKGPTELRIAITLWSMSGESFRLDNVFVEGAKEIPLEPLVAEAGSTFRRGRLELVHFGRPLELGAQVVMKDERRGRLFYEQLFDPEARFKSSRLEGLWWLPQISSQFDLFLANRRDSQLQVEVDTASIDGEQASENLLLAPHEIRALDLGYRRGPHRANAGAVSIRHSGRGGDLLARGMIASRAPGSSLQVAFQDSATQTSTSLHGAGLRLGRSFGRRVDPVLLVRNMHEHPMTVHTAIVLTDADGHAHEVALPPVELFAGQVGDLSTVAQKSLRELSLPLDGSVAGVELTHEGSPGGLIAAALSASPDGTHVAQVPMLDPESIASSSGGFPWLVDDQTTTLLHFKNTTEEQQTLLFHVWHSEGIYSPGLQVIGPGETRTVDIGSLRDEPAPGYLGQALPADATWGRVLWSSEASGGKVLTGRAEYINLADGTSRTYSCENCCPDSFYAGTVDPSPGPLLVGAQIDLDAKQWKENCYGEVGLPIEVQLVDDWDSDNASAVTVDPFTGEIMAEGIGLAVITASWRSASYEGTFCSQVTHSIERSVQVLVNQLDTDEYVAVGWVDSSGITLPSGAFFPLVLDLNDPLGCPVVVGEWAANTPLYLISSTERDYANKFLLKNSGNSDPGSSIDASSVQTAGDYRLFNRFKVRLTTFGGQVSSFLTNGASVARVGNTPDPCGLVPAASPEIHSQNAARGITANSARVYQLNQGRLGTLGQRVDRTINYFGDPLGSGTPWIWSAIKLGADGTLAGVDRQSFPAYSVYRNGVRIQNHAQGSLSAFIAKDSSSQRSTSEIN